MYLGKSQETANTTFTRGTDEGGKLKETGTFHWNSPNTGATNESGFTALPGGYRPGYLSGEGNSAVFWTVSGYDAQTSWYRSMSSGDAYKKGAGEQEPRTLGPLCRGLGGKTNSIDHLAPDHEFNYNSHKTKAFRLSIKIDLTWSN